MHHSVTFNPYTAPTAELTLPGQSKPLSLSVRAAILTPALFVVCMLLNMHYTDRLYVGFPELMKLEYSAQGMSIEPNGSTLTLVLLACYFGSRLFCRRFAKLIDEFPAPRNCGLAVCILLTESIAAGSAEFWFPGLRAHVMLVLAAHLTTVSLILAFFRRYLFAILGSLFAAIVMLFARILSLPLIGIHSSPWTLEECTVLAVICLIHAITSSFLVFLLRLIWKRHPIADPQSHASPSSDSTDWSVKI